MDLENFINRFSGYSDSYKFYNDTIEILYDKTEHVYKLVQGDDLIEIPSVTTIIHKTVDKSQVLINWGCNEMSKKLLSLIPTFPYTTSKESLEGLLQVAKRAHKEKLEDAGDVGTLAHNWIEKFINNSINREPLWCPNCMNREWHYPNCGNLLTPSFPVDHRACNAIKASLDWMLAHNVRWLSTETKVYSRIHKVAGTFDGLALIDSCNDPLCCPKQFKDHKSMIDWKTSNDLYFEYLIQLSAYWGALTEIESCEHPDEPLIEDGWIIRLGKDDAEFETWHITDSQEFELYYYGFLNAHRWYCSMEHAQSQMKLKNDTLRLARKAQRKVEKEAQLKLKCANHETYKGIREPRCNKGNPCLACLEKYKNVHGTA